jgi:hypothetical protein
MATNQFDAQLHVLRSIGRTYGDVRERADFESARFNLFAAIQSNDWESAQRWLRAVRTAFETSQFQLTSVAVRDGAAVIAEIDSMLRKATAQ